MGWLATRARWPQFGAPGQRAKAIAAVDVFTEDTTFHVMQSIRLDLGYGSQVHP